MVSSSLLLPSFLVQTLLVSVRLLPLLVVAPVAVFARIPVFVRGISALVFGAVLAAGLAPADALQLTPGVLASEFLNGLVLAFGIHVAIAGVDMVGRLIDLQVGLNASGVFDPATSNISSLIAEIFSLGFLMLFVALDLHHDLLRAFSQLLILLPPGQVATGLISPAMGAFLGKQFLAAFVLASPIIIGLWLTDVAFAFMSRSLPQANVYFLALPVKLGVGLVLLLLSMPVLLQGMAGLFRQALDPLAAMGVQP